MVHKQHLLLFLFKTNAGNIKHGHIAGISIRNVLEYTPDFTIHASVTMLLYTVLKFKAYHASYWK